MSVELWCLFLAGLLHTVTKMPLAKAQGAAPGGYDNHNPREQQAALTGWGRRALAAHENQIESFPLFAAGVLVAVAAGVGSPLVGYLAVAYIAARLLYLYLYLKDVSTPRSLAWGVGYLASLALLCSPLWG
jgi:uncharacterized MAPEG superfamily protein